MVKINFDWIDYQLTRFSKKKKVMVLVGFLNLFNYGKRKFDTFYYFIKFAFFGLYILFIEICQRIFYKQNDIRKFCKKHQMREKKYCLITGATSGTFFSWEEK